MTDDINDVRHTSTLAKFEEAVRRSSPVSETLAETIAELHYNRVRDRTTKLHGEPIMPLWQNAKSSARQNQIEDAIAIIAAVRSSDHAQSPRERALERAALDFVHKVDRGEARSKRSYADFKAALSMSSVDRAMQQLADQAQELDMGYSSPSTLGNSK